MKEEEFGQIDINKRLKNDLRYIESEMIAKHLKRDTFNNNRYIKFSRALNGIAIMDLSQEQYERYWLNKYNKYPELQKKLLEAIRYKFNNDLIPTDIMVEIIKNSEDLDSEKKKAIKLLINNEGENNG